MAAVEGHVCKVFRLLQFVRRRLERRHVVGEDLEGIEGDGTAPHGKGDLQFVRFGHAEADAGVALVAVHVRAARRKAVGARFAVARYTEFGVALHLFRARKADVHFLARAAADGERLLPRNGKGLPLCGGVQRFERAKPLRTRLRALSFDDQPLEHGVLPQERIEGIVILPRQGIRIDEAEGHIVRIFKQRVELPDPRKTGVVIHAVLTVIVAAGEQRLQGGAVVQPRQPEVLLRIVQLIFANEAVRFLPVHGIVEHGAHVPVVHAAVVETAPPGIRRLHVGAEKLRLVLLRDVRLLLRKQSAVDGSAAVLRRVHAAEAKRVHDRQHGGEDH